MSSTSLLKAISLDRAISAIVITGCVGLFVDADAAGRAPLKGETPAATEISSRSALIPFDKLSPKQCRHLSQHGYLVVDNFLSDAQIRRARACIHHVEKQGKFERSPNEQNAHEETKSLSTSSIDLVRTDRVYMSPRRPSDVSTEASNQSQNRSSSLAIDSGLSDIHDCLAQFAHALTKSDFCGFDQDNPGGIHSDCHRHHQTRRINVPAQMQVSIYGGGRGEGSGYYRSHVDSSAADSSLWELGVLGWLRSRYLRHRYVSCIVYLNTDWKESDGGCLRLLRACIDDSDDLGDDNYDESDILVDIPPVAGRLVVFSSWHQWHAVLPAKTTRYACSLWLTTEQ